MSPARTRGDPRLRERRRATSGTAGGRLPLGLGMTHTSPSRAPTRRLRSEPRTSSSWRRRPTCSAATTSGCASWSGPSAHLEAGETLRAVRCAFWVGIELRAPGEIGAGERLARPRAAAARARRPRCVERGYLLLPVMLQHEAAGDFEAARADRGRGRRDRRALRRRRPGRARRARAGPHADQAGPGRRRASRCWTRRWSRSPPASSRRSSPGSSIAASSTAARRSTSCAARASGPPR